VPLEPFTPRPLAPGEPQRQFRFNVALEFAVVLMVITACTAVLLGEIDAAQFKARFAEVLQGWRAPQLEKVERIALTGSVAEGSFAAQPELRGHAGRIDLTVRSAILDAPEAATVIFLCGERAAPPGWTASGPPARSNLAPRQLVSQCRKDGTQ
jgi:hypothetical protein